MLTANLIDAHADELTAWLSGVHVISSKVRSHMAIYTFPSNDEFSTKQKTSICPSGLPAKTRIVRTESLFRNIAIRGCRVHPLTGIWSDLGFYSCWATSFKVMCKSNRSFPIIYPTSFHMMSYLFFITTVNIRILNWWPLPVTGLWLTVCIALLRTTHTGFRVWANAYSGCRSLKNPHRPFLWRHDCTDVVTVGPSGH